MALRAHLDNGRRAYERAAWSEAVSELTDADQDRPLEYEDLERLAFAAALMGKDEESAEAWTRAHHLALEHDDAPRAARAAFWLGLKLINRGDMAQGGGWMARAARVIEESGRDCVERGYLLIPRGLQALGTGDTDGALQAFGEAAEFARRYKDRELETLACLGQGKSHVAAERVVAGIDLLDEAMVAVAAGEVSAMVTGIVYCAVIETYRDIFDLRRAREWTIALDDWCRSQPDLVPFRGQCLVHRAEILQLHGSWKDALAEAEQASDRLSRPTPHPALGEALYRRADLHRLRGELDAAEAAYLEAGRAGREPQPGLALLRLAQGKEDAAAAAIRSAAAGTTGAERLKLLPDYVEIMLGVGEEAEAHAAAEELSAVAAEVGAPFLLALADHAQGSVLLAGGDAYAALDRLIPARDALRRLEAPYLAARTDVLIGFARTLLGDQDTARMSFEAAVKIFEDLGARPDLEWASELSRPPQRQDAGGLTGREIEVLSLVATGRTNRAIADALVISEKTVARHVSNIFTKLGVGSRAAATAYAYEHDLI